MRLRRRVWLTSAQAQWGKLAAVGHGQIFRHAEHPSGPAAPALIRMLSAGLWGLRRRCGWLNVIVSGELIALHDLLHLVGIVGVGSIAGLVKRLDERRRVAGVAEGLLIPRRVV